MGELNLIYDLGVPRLCYWPCINSGSNESGIYAIINNSTGRVYIGSASNIRRRKSVHMCQLHSQRHDNSHLQRSWDKYGSNSFSFHIVEPTKDLVNRENFYMNQFKSISYNNQLVSYRNSNIVFTEERKEKLRGKVYTQEMRKNMSQGQKNKVFTPEYKKEIYDKISKTQTGKTSFNIKAANAAHRRLIIQCDLNGNEVARFNSIKEASMILGISGPSIWNRVKNKPLKGLRHKYILTYGR